MDFFFLINKWSVSDFSKWHVSTGRREKTTYRVYQISGSGAGERVSLQQVPNPEAEDRDRSFISVIGATDQDMVPEPANEVQEGQPFAQHQKRSPKKR